MSTGRPMTGVSASQIDTYKTCRRKWYFSSVLRLPRTQAPSAALGTALHEHNEKYLVSGEKPKGESESAKLFYAGLSFLPQPGSVYPELDIEKIALPGFDLAGIPVRGRIDQTDLRGLEPHIEDFKTSSSLKFTLTEEQLTRDPQMVIYASWVRRYVMTLGRPEPEGVSVSHLVFLTKGQNIVKRTGPVRLSRQMLDEQLSVLAAVTEKMKETSLCSSVDKVEPTLSACRKYNKDCDFAKYCTAFGAISSQSSTISSTPGGASPFAGIEETGKARLAPCSPDDQHPVPEKPMNPLEALAQLKAKNAAGNAAPPPVVQVQAPPPPVQQVQQAVPQGQVKSALELLAEKARAASNGVAVPAKGLLSHDAPAQVQAPIVVVASAPTPAPVQVQQAPAAVAAAAPLTQVHQRKPKGYMTKLTGLGYTEPQIEEMGVDQMHDIIDDEIRADAPVQQPLPTEAPAVAPVVAPVQVQAELPKAQVPTLKVQDGLTLYIDCMPSKGVTPVFQKLEDILLPYMANVAAGGEKGDGRAPLAHYSMIGYNQGQSRVVASVLTNPPNGVIVADTRYPCTHAVLEVLVPMAEHVVRSMR